MSAKLPLIILFWACGIGSLFSYFLYPAILLLWARKPLHRSLVETLPPMSLIIAAHNEESRIIQKLRNTMLLDYPRDLLEIIVASDASDDSTDALVQSLESSGVTLSRSDTRAGKEAAQARAIAISNGEVLVFTDSATRLERDALQRIAYDFSDPTVGAVSSEDRLESSGAHDTPSGEGAYVSYEMWLRRHESERAGLVGLSGSLFAVRRSVAQHWPANVPSDITAALRTASLGLRAIADQELPAYYSDLRDLSKEYERKVRTVVRGMAAVANMSELLNPFHYGVFSFQLWGHKVMRWAAPMFMLLLWGVSGFLWTYSGFFAFVFAAQTIVYLVALIVWFAPGLRRIRALWLVFYLVQVHIALLHAAIRFCRGERIVVWTPSKR